MNQQEFQSQVIRLVDQFGKQSYGTERAMLIWGEVRDLSGDWFRDLIDRFIGDCRHAPLLPEFREAVSIERERIWAIEKAQHRNEAERAMRQYFDPEFIGSICKKIVSRLEGQVDDVEYSNFTKTIGHAAQAVRPTGEKLPCQACFDDGIIFQTGEGGGDYVFRCYCMAGQRQPKAYPVYQRTNSENPNHPKQNRGVE